MAAKKKTTGKRGRPRKIVEPSVVDVLPKPQEPQGVSVLITGTCPNPMWVKGVDKNKKLYKIRVPKRLSKKLLHKQITVKPIADSPEGHYQYEP